MVYCKELALSTMRATPMICCLQTRDWVFVVQRPEGSLRAGSVDFRLSEGACRAGEDNCPRASRYTEREFTLLQPFHPIQPSIDGMVLAYVAEEAVFISSQVQVLMSSGNILTDTPRHNI